jgi:signal transduction histidine kinase
MDSLDPRSRHASLPARRAIRLRRRIAGLNRSELLQHAVLGVQLNIFTALPLSLSLLVFSNDRSGAHFVAIVWVVSVVTNCNFLALTAFYYAAWQSWRPRGVVTYLALGGVILPLVGMFSALVARVILGAATPARVPPQFPPIVAASMLLAVLYGLGFYSNEDFRRAQKRVLRQLESSQRMRHAAEGARDRAEVVCLQSLIKPHFIFNTLTAITTLIHEDPHRAEDVTLRLARLMRYLLELEDGALMSLESEFGVVRAYLEIEKVRLGNRLQYEVEAPAELLSTAIPSMVLQPLVENAVHHGVRERDDSGRIVVRATADSGYCQVEIIDNGPGFREGKGGGRSMRLVRDRLSRLYGRDYELRLERDGRDAQTVVTLRLPVSLPRISPEVPSHRHRPVPGQERAQSQPAV